MFVFVEVGLGLILHKEKWFLPDRGSLVIRNLVKGSDALPVTQLRHTILSILCVFIEIESLQTLPYSHHLTGLVFAL